MQLLQCIRMQQARGRALSLHAVRQRQAGKERLLGLIRHAQAVAPPANPLAQRIVNGIAQRIQHLQRL